MIKLTNKRIPILALASVMVLSVILIQSVCAQVKIESTESKEILQVADLLATSNSRVHSGYEDSLRFRQFKTYNFDTPTQFDDPGFSEVLLLQFSAAIEEQLLKRGFTRSENPDILVNVTIDLKNATSAPKRSMTYISGSGVCPSYRFYNGGPRLPSSSGSMPTVCEFKEGSIKVDLIFQELKRAIWSGVSLVRIGKKEGEHNLINQRTLLGPIVTDVNIMFENFPFRFHQNIEGSSEDS